MNTAPWKQQAIGGPLTRGMNFIIFKLYNELELSRYANNLNCIESINLSKFIRRSFRPLQGVFF